MFLICFLFIEICYFPIDDIRQLEDKTKADLEEARNTGEVRGIKL